MPQQKSKTNQPSQQIELTLDRPDSRLDQALAEELADLSRVQIQRLIKEGHVHVAGIKKVKAPKINPPERVVMLKANNTIFHPSLNGDDKVDAALFLIFFKLISSFSTKA